METIEDYALTPEQINLAMKVGEAIDAAHRIGVSFWNNDGTLTAFNANKITLPVPRKTLGSIEFTSGIRRAITLPLQIDMGAFHAGNQMEMLWFKVVDADINKKR